MPFISIKVEGFDQVISGLNDIMSGLNNTRRNALEEISSFMADEMRANAHVITGRMKGSIKSQVLGDSAIVEVPVPYANVENKRPGSKAGYGPHNFADMAVNATAVRAPQIIIALYDGLIRL